MCLLQGFEVTHGVGGLAKTPLAGCSPTSDAGTRPQGSSWEGKKDKKVWRARTSWDSSRSWRPRGQTEILSLILVGWARAEMLKEDAGEGGAVQAQLLLHPTLLSHEMRLQNASLLPSRSPPSCPLGPTPNAALKGREFCGLQLSLAKPTPYKATTADKVGLNYAKQGRIFYPSDGAGSLVVDTNGCLF